MVAVGPKFYSAIAAVSSTICASLKRLAKVLVQRVEYETQRETCCDGFAGYYLRSPRRMSASLAVSTP
jgi:hypothetical protein